MIHKILKKIKAKDVEDLLSKFNKNVKNIKQGMSDDNYRVKYEETRKLFMDMVKELFNIEGVVTFDEIVDIMNTSNISSDVIQRSRKFFDQLVEIDYSFYDFTKEDLFDLIEDCELLFEDIYNQRLGDMVSKEENLSKFQKGMVLNKFKAEMERIKKLYHKKVQISTKQILKATEYYEKLDVAEKEKYSKEFHDYCINIYHIFVLLNDLKEDDRSDVEKTHILISKVNKIFFKLDEKERNKLYPMILQMVDSHEEKLNFYIFGGYEYIHKKDFMSASSLYPKMMQHFEGLNDEKKKFYSTIISRYMDNIRESLKKKERKENILNIKS